MDVELQGRVLVSHPCCHGSVPPPFVSLLAGSSIFSPMLLVCDNIVRHRIDVHTVGGVMSSHILHALPLSLPAYIAPNIICVLRCLVLFHHMLFTRMSIPFPVCNLLLDFDFRFVTRVCHICCWQLLWSRSCRSSAFMLFAFDLHALSYVGFLSFGLSPSTIEPFIGPHPPRSGLGFIRQILPLCSFPKSPNVAPPRCPYRPICMSPSVLFPMPCFECACC